LIVQVEFGKIAGIVLEISMLSNRLNGKWQFKYISGERRVYEYDH